MNEFRRPPQISKPEFQHVANLAFDAVLNNVKPTPVNVDKYNALINAILDLNYDSDRPQKFERLPFNKK